MSSTVCTEDIRPFLPDSYQRGALLDSGGVVPDTARTSQTAHTIRLVESLTATQEMSDGAHPAHPDARGSTTPADDRAARRAHAPPARRVRRSDRRPGGRGIGVAGAQGAG